MSNEDKIRGGILHMVVPVEMHRHIKQAAALEGITMTNWVIRACDFWLDENSGCSVGKTDISKK